MDIINKFANQLALKKAALAEETLCKCLLKLEKDFPSPSEIRANGKKEIQNGVETYFWKDKPIFEITFSYAAEDFGFKVHFLT